MPRDRKSPLRTGPKPEAAPREPRAKPVKRKAARPKVSLPAVIEPTGPLAGFSELAASDYAVKNENGRYLTVSPLRAIMAEELAREGEHVVTERTRQGVLFGVGLGMDSRTMAVIYGLETDEFERLYAREIATSTHLMMNDVAVNMFNIARDPSHSGSVRAGMYMLGKLGNRIYKEQQRGELAVNPQTRTIDPAMLTDEQRDALRDILSSALRLASPGGAVVEADYDDVDDGDMDDDAKDVL